MRIQLFICFKNFESRLPESGKEDFDVAG